MLDILIRIERELPHLLRDDVEWQSLWIDYEHPYVERLWRPFGVYRIFLHRIHPCASQKPLFHPHPWPSAMRVHRGTYEMGIGFGPGDVPPPVAARIILPAGAVYEMTDVDGWHWVRPLENIVDTVMVIGTPWDRWSPKPTGECSPLPDAVAAALVEDFRTYYPVTHA